MIQNVFILIFTRFEYSLENYTRFECSLENYTRFECSLENYTRFECSLENYTRFECSFHLSKLGATACPDSSTCLNSFVRDGKDAEQTCLNYNRFECSLNLHSFRV